MHQILVLLLCLPCLLCADDFFGKRVIDLTYSFNENTIYWPTAQSFKHEQVAWGMSKAGYWYSSSNYSASEHGGTHLDAPIHFAEERWTSDEIPVEQFMGPVFVIDVSEKCAKNADYQLSVEDIKEWESTNGTIPEHSIVLIRTGWGKFWPDKKKYLGDDTPGDASKLHFPGYSKASAEFLVNERKIKGAGLDTASLDPGNSKDFIAHQIFNKANVYGLENVANLDQIPPRGAQLIALPMKIEKGTGGPVRIIGLID